MARWAVSILIWAVAAHAAADDSPASVDPLRARLKSPVSSEVAWGLHDAIEARAKNVDDLVREVIAARVWGSPADSRAVRTAAIDAVIELDVALPDETLVALARETGIARRLLLCARSPGACRDVLLGVLAERTEDDAWTAACNLLLPLRDARLTHHLLGHLQLEASLTVCDPGDDELHLGGGWSVAGSGTGCGRVGEPDAKGWPPRCCWVLVTTPSASARLVAKGRESIYACRRTLETGDFVCSSMPSAWSRERDSSQHLADLLPLDVDKLRSALSEYETVHFTDTAEWLRAVESIRAVLVRRWVALLAMCYLDGVLTFQQALTLAPRVQLRLNDVRGTKQPALEIPPALGRIRR